jgi:hypothetical protein
LILGFKEILVYIMSVVIQSGRERSGYGL